MHIVSPTRLGAAGGDRIALQGDFDPYLVYSGTLVSTDTDANDAPLFTANLVSGIPGSSAGIKADSTSLLYAYSPPFLSTQTTARVLLYTPVIPGVGEGNFTSGTPVYGDEPRQFNVVLKAGNLTISSDNSIAVTAQFFFSTVYEMRRYLPNWVTGPKDTAQEGVLWPAP